MKLTPFTLLVVWGLASPLRADSAALLHQLNAIPYEERLDFLKKSMSNPDPEVVATAGEELVKVCERQRPFHGRRRLNGLGERPASREAITAVVAALKTEERGSPSYQRLFLSRARLLYGVGKLAEARALYDEAAAAGWKGNTARAKTLYDLDPLQYAVYRFNEAVANPHAYAKQGHYLRLLCVEKNWPNRRRRTRDPSSMKEVVLPHLVFAPEDALHWRVAQAVCQIIDREYDAGIASLNEIETAYPLEPMVHDEPPQAFFRKNEPYNLPLYLAAAKMFGGKDLDGARLAMERFWKINEHRPDYASRALMRIAGSLNRVRGTDRVARVTGFLIENGVTTNPKVGKNFRRHVLSMDIAMHFSTNDWKKVTRRAPQLLEDFDPLNESCNNGLYYLGYANRMIAYEKQRPDLYEAAAGYFQRLIDSPMPRWQRVGKASILQIYAFLGDPIRPLPVLEQYMKDLAVAPPGESIYYSPEVLAIGFAERKAAEKARSKER